MIDKDILLAADMLFRHRLNKTGLKSLPNKLMPKTIAESYQIQNEVKILYLTLKDNICIGKKVGCTNKIAQEQVGIFEPFYGNLFSKFHDFTGCKLNSKKFYKPFIEPEISFILKKDININDAPFTIDNVDSLFDGILPSIEIVDFRFGDNIKDVGIKNLIITNGASEFWVRGNEIFPINSIDLKNHEIKLYFDNELKEIGNVNSVLGNPIYSALWLVNKLSELGEPMLKGQFITTGTCTRAVPLYSNMNILVDFGNLGKLEINYI